MCVASCMVEIYFRLANVIAFSGQALTQRPQAWQASGIETIACFHRCAKPLIFPFSVSVTRTSLGTMPIVNTCTGHTSIHGPLPSHWFGLMTGNKKPAGCLVISVVFTSSSL
jgi:hypothetical protein